MIPSLPARPSLRQLQIQAKDLVKRLRLGDPDAVARFRRWHPALAAPPYAEPLKMPSKLSDAQLVVAREYGFDSWSKLKAEIERAGLRELAAAVQAGDIARARSLLRQNSKLINLDMAETDEHRVIHYAVLRRDEPMVRALMRAGADAHKGIYPEREATSAYVLAQDREFHEIVHAIEDEEQFRREKLSCPNATVSPAQEELTKLIRALDHARAIEMLATDPALVKACDRDGCTALHVACEEAALPVIDWLLDHQANPRKENLKGLTPLDAALLRIGWKSRDRCRSFPPVAWRLLRRGATMSPLTASALGEIDELSALYERSPALVRDAHKQYRTGPISVAVMFGQMETLRYLLDLGLDVDEGHRLPDLEEKIVSWGNPLWLASAFGEYEMAQMLLDRGADPNGAVYASGTPVHRAYGARDERMKRLLAAYGGKPAPHLIGWYRDIDAAAALLAGELTEDTAVDLLWGAACGGSPEIVAMTLPLISWERSDARWHRMLTSPIRLANHSPVSEHPEEFDRSTYPECLRLILHHGVDPNVLSRKGETLLHGIAAAGKTWGIDVMTNDERSEFTNIALSFDPDLLIRDDLLKSTPLGWACRWGRVDMVRLVLGKGALAEEPEAEAWATPAAWARKRGQPEIVALLG